MSNKTLSEKAKRILILISTGHSYERIVKINPGYTYLDIFKAAEEALNLLTNDGHSSHSSYQERVAKIREKYPRAYESWSDEEEQKLIELHHAGKSTKEMCAELE